MTTIYPEPVVSMTSRINPFEIGERKPSLLEFLNPWFWGGRPVSCVLHMEANYNYAQWKTKRITEYKNGKCWYG